MREVQLGEVRLDGGLVEVRRYEWREPEQITFHRENYMLSRLLVRTQGQGPMGWQLPCAAHTRPAAAVSVVPPGSPVSVQFEKGEAVIVSCILNPDFFEATTGIADWTEQHTLLCLGLRSPLFGLIFRRLAHEVYFARDNSARVAEGFVGALATEVARGLERSLGERREGQLSPWQLERVYNLIDAEQGGLRLTIEQLAYRCAMSPRHLMRAFKASTGLTIHQYANECRMSRAAEALRAGDIPLKVLAGRLGFSSPSSFTAAFRQNLGCTPTEFRRRSRAA